MKAKISEIFQSIQGEGQYAGVRQVFVRFFGCHMHCVWCDTPDSIGDGKKEYREYSLEKLAQEVRGLAAGCHSVSLTGGEPLLQADFVREFIPYIRETRLGVYLETSGVLYQELAKVIDSVDIIAMDIKLPSSTQCRAFWKEHEEFLRIARWKNLFIKAVVSGETSLDDLRRAIHLVKTADPDLIFYLQPNHFQVQNGALTNCLKFQAEFQKDLKGLRILPQVHKFINLR